MAVFAQVSRPQWTRPALGAQLAEAQLQVRRAERKKRPLTNSSLKLPGAQSPCLIDSESPTLSRACHLALKICWLSSTKTAEMRQAVVQIDKSDASLGSEKAQRIPNLFTVSVGSQYDRSVRERVNTVGLSMPCRCLIAITGGALSFRFSSCRSGPGPAQCC